MNRPLTARDWVGFMIMVFGMFMAILDIQIVSSPISEIQAGLAASSDEISWVQTSYLIAEVVMIPLTGILSRLMSTRVFFSIAAAGFTLTSMLCALAWDINSMIIFRALQGFLGGAMIPTVFATSFIVFPPERRNFLSVLMGLVATMAPTPGPRSAAISPRPSPGIGCSWPTCCPASWFRSASGCWSISTRPTGRC